MPVSPTVRDFASEHYIASPNPVVMINLAQLVTVYYHDIITGTTRTPGVHAYNAYMILAMCREMSQGE